MTSNLTAILSLFTSILTLILSGLADVLTFLLGHPYFLLAVSITLIGFVWGIVSGFMRH